MPESEKGPGGDSAGGWYKDAVIYELNVRSFYDSVRDGLGDFAGLTQKLDYLQDLGVTAVWLLPFCPSPLRDDGYDISDYTNVHPAYGTLRDFQTFLREAHRRGLRVITELVLNHTSDQHVWFQRSRRAPAGSRWRNFYVWSDTPDKYAEARTIFKDFETSNWTWDPVAKAYYWHRFYSHQPDLNYENPEVRSAMLAAMDFWFDLGVDGLRLDAVPYLYEEEGTNCENLPQTHGFLKELRGHVDRKYRDKMLLAEANQWPEDAAAYFGQGDESHMAFHFPLMPRLFMGTRMEDRYPITDILRLTPAIPESCQWALFLRNHDELTLEMVTDEERDYMYRAYAHDRQMRVNLGIRRRLAPLLGNDRRKIELMNALLFSLPGTPVIYYGDEIGMGDNFYLGDRNGVRTPMQWSADRNAGFSRSNPQQLYLPIIIDPEYHYETVNVEAQQNNPHSLLWWMKRLIAQRKRFRAFGRGSLELLGPQNRKVLAFVRQYQDERILVVANLSRFAQCVELDLTKRQGMTPVEIFGRTEFPPVTDRPYVLTMGPHAFYWFQLEQKGASQEALTISPEAATVPVFAVGSWEDVFSGAMRADIARVMPAFLQVRRWFLGKGRRIRFVEVADIIPIGETAHVLILRVEYSEGEAEHYVLPLAVAREEKAERLLQQTPQFVLARLEAADGTRGALHGAVPDRDFCEALLTAIVRRRRFKGERGELIASHTKGFRKLWSGAAAELEPAVLPGQHNHTTIKYGNRLLLKLFRRIEAEINPDQEIGEFLTQQAGLASVPAAAGSLEYRLKDGTVMTLGILRAFVPHEGDGWTYTVDNLGLFFDRALAQAGPAALAELAAKPPWQVFAERKPQEPPPPLVKELMGSYLDMVQVLGRRTAELHLALASHPELPEFGPEPFTDFYRQSLYHSMLGQMNRCFEQLRGQSSRLPAGIREEAEGLLRRESELRRRFQALRDRRIYAVRIRHHGDYQLREVLFTGKDFVIIDFEGDGNRPMSQRRIKRSPLRDVASMLRSFHYAASAALYGQVPGITPSKETLPALEKWAEWWYAWVGGTFLGEYLRVAGSAEFIPRSQEELRILLECYLLEKALREIEHELRDRVEWVRIPLRGVLQLLESR